MFAVLILEHGCTLCLVCLVGRFENGGQSYSGVLNHPALTGDVFSVSAALHWLDLLLAALDAYTWALGKKLLSPSEVFSGELLHSCLYVDVHTYMTHCISCSVCLCVYVGIHSGSAEAR